MALASKPAYPQYFELYETLLQREIELYTTPYWKPKRAEANSHPKPQSAALRHEVPTPRTAGPADAAGEAAGIRLAFLKGVGDFLRLLSFRV